MKRTLDILVSSTLLLVLSPLAILLAAMVKLDSTGPVLFRQRRVGRDGRPFELLKFRSMTVLEGAESGRFDAGSSARVTRIGRVLRRTKLDEIPQLLNVLRGDMSLVGPRPEVERWTLVYPERWRIVHEVRPGLTDRASIEFIDEESILAASRDPEETYRSEILPRKLDHGEAYARGHSLVGDARIMLATAAALFHRPESVPETARHPEQDEALT